MKYLGNILRSATLILAGFGLLGSINSNEINSLKYSATKNEMNYKEFAEEKGLKGVEQIISEEDSIIFIQHEIDDKADIYKYDKKTKQIENMTADNPNGFDGNFVLRGDILYFLREDKSGRNIYSMDIKTKQIKQLIQNEIYPEDIAVNKQGTKILYVNVGKSEDIYELDIKANSTEPITQTLKIEEKDPFYSDDGKKIVYVLESSVNSEIKIKDIEKDTIFTALKSETDLYSNPAIFDTLLVYQSRNASGTSKICAVSLNELKNKKPKLINYKGVFSNISDIQFNDQGDFIYIGQTSTKKNKLVFGNIRDENTFSITIDDKIDFKKNPFTLFKDGKSAYVFLEGGIKELLNPKYQVQTR